MMKAPIYLFALILMTSACSKDDDFIIPPMPDTPIIQLLSAGPGTVTALQDSIVFILHYADGNGDLGFNSPDSLSLYITDNRIDLTEALFVPLLAPEGADIAIQGELEIELQNTIMTIPGAEMEEVTFTIQIRDRAGNWSNAVTSPVIVVTAE